MILRTLLRLQSRRARRVHRFAVSTTSDATPNSPDFVNHAKTVAHDRDFTGRVMIPAHGSLAQPQTGEMGEMGTVYLLQAERLNIGHRR